MTYGCIVSDNGITVHFSDGDDFTWPCGHPRFDEVREAIKGGADETSLREMMDTIGNLQRQMETQPAFGGSVQVTRDGVFWHGRPIHMTVTDRILSFNAEGFPIKPLVNFLDKLLSNQRREAVLSLYDFLEANNVPITEDGDFLVYKKVRGDYKDIHSGAFDNSVGQKPRVPHWEVDPDRDNTCSNGLHVCSRAYLPSFGSYSAQSVGPDRVVICKVNPSDVVAVPRDYNNSKMRVAGYEVVGELNDEQKAEIFDQAKIVHHGDYQDDIAWGENSEWDKEQEEESPDFSDYNPEGYDECEVCGNETDGSDICEECQEQEEDERDESEVTQTSWRNRWINPFRRGK